MAVIINDFEVVAEPPAETESDSQKPRNVEGKGVESPEAVESLWRVVQDRQDRLRAH
jgi:hypothetical protein